MAAGRALERVGELGLVDRRRAVEQRGGRVLIPLARPPEDPLGLDEQVVEAALEANPRLAPYERMRWALEDELPSEALEALPRGWQVLGEVCLVQLPDPLVDHGAAIGRALGESLGVATVLEDRGCHGELREPETRRLWGQADTRTVHREHGLVFHLDPAQVMFSAGNKHERHRLVDQVDPGEQVVDLFAGIGYFTLPLARAGAHVVACEKNPASAGFLEQNVAANELGHRVEVRRGDCRELAPEGVADRVLLGYFPGTWRFLACALRALDPQGGMLHYHTTAREPDPLAAARQELRDHLAPGAPETRVVHARRVKSYAPGVAHVVLDVAVGGAAP